MLNVQPVIPLAGGKVITRTIFPFVWLPDVTSESGSFSSGLSDILFTAFYVPSSGSTMWGLGPVLEFPSGGENRGTQKWSAGVSGVLLAQPGDWTLGLLANNVGSFAGDSDRKSVSMLMIKPFVYYALSDSWDLMYVPYGIQVYWNKPSGEKMYLPIGGGAQYMTHLGSLGLNLGAQLFNNVVRPTNGTVWDLRFLVELVF